MLRRALPILLASFCALALPPLGAAAPSRSERTAARTIVVRFAPSVSSARRAQLLARAGARPVRTLRQVGYVVARVARSRRAAALALLRHSPETLVAQGSQVFHALDTVPADPGYTGTPWPWQQLGLPRAWDFGTGSPSVVIAVVDTGVFAGQADLAGRVLPGVDEVNGDGNADDDQGHGTEVATTAAGAMNRLGAIGACPACSILPVKVMDARGTGTDANIAAGVIWAADHGASIVNLSLGGSSSDPVLAAAVAYAISKNVLVVAAAGNGGSSELSYPAAYDGVVSVGASDQTGALQGFSQFGSWVDVAAPGCVTAGDRGNALTNVCGTSFAAPLVAGAAGLVLASNPGYTAAQVKSLLETTATVTGASVRTGVVNAAGMFAGATPPPTAAPTSPAASQPVARPRPSPPRGHSARLRRARYRDGRQKNASAATASARSDTAATSFRPLMGPPGFAVPRHRPRLPRA